MLGYSTWTHIRQTGYGSSSLPWFRWPAMSWPVTAPTLSRLLAAGAYLAGVGLVIAVVVAFRLPRLAEPTDNYDEGVYLESLLLMHHGYHPFTDIVATQGPLHLYIAYIAYMLGGYTLAAARMGAVLASTIGLLGIGVAAHVIAGRWAGLAAALALALSPTFLSVSRQTLPEAPALALAICAVTAAAFAQRTGPDRWRLLAGLLIGLACLVKPLVVPAALPTLLLAAAPRSWRSTVIAPAAAIVVCASDLLLVGAAGAYDQIVAWRLTGHQVALSAVGHNASLLTEKMLGPEQPAFYVAAAVGAIALLVRQPRVGVAIAVWLVAQLGALLCDVSLSSHLGVALIPPLAILSGCAVGTVAGRLGRAPRGAFIVATIVTLSYVVSIPALLDRDARLVGGQIGGSRDQTPEQHTAVRILADATVRTDLVLTDEPYLAFLANRDVPPPLVDPSLTRIQQGALTSADVARVMATYRPKMVVVWTGKLSQFDVLSGALAADFRLVREFPTSDDDAPRAIYRRRNPD